MKKIYVIHENDDWVVPLRAAFDKLDLPYEEWFINKMNLDLNAIPPDGIFYNRMSASAHTRDHRYAPEITANILAWLERYGRKVVNGRRALQLELRKSEQYLALQVHNILHPNTIIANNQNDILNAVDKLNEFPFILKPNRGGKGAGVQLFYSKESLKNSMENDAIGESLDGIWLVQQYVKPANGRIVRAEFVGNEFLYAVSIDASKGFELCPADSCNVGDAFCPADQSTPQDKFIILDQYQNPELEKYSNFLKDNNIGVGALEYVEDEQGQKYVYDVNTNTNYNSGAEQASLLKKEGMFEIANYLGKELQQLKNKDLKRA